MIQKTNPLQAETENKSTNHEHEIAGYDKVTLKLESVQEASKIYEVDEEINKLETEEEAAEIMKEKQVKELKKKMKIYSR